MSIGKNSINRVAAGLDNENAAPMTDVTVPTAVETAIVEGTAKAAAETPVTTPTEVEAAIVEGTAEAAVKKPAAKKPRTKKTPETETPAEAAPAEATVAPELVGQSVAAPAAKRRGRKPGSKNKKTVAAKKPAAPRKTNRIPRAPETAKSFLAVAIGEDLPVYLL